MDWVENLASRFRNTRVLQTSKSFVHDRCPINLTAMPTPSAILDADELKKQVEEVGEVVDENPFCDLVALADYDDQPTAILIEAKTDRTHANARTREAIDQLSWSFDHLEKVALICAAVPVEFERYPVFTYTKISDAVLRSSSVRQRAREFRELHRARVRFVPAGTDIWQEVQRNLP